MPRETIVHRGVTFTLTVEDDPDYEGYVHMSVECDPPPRGLDIEVYSLRTPAPRETTTRNEAF